MILTTKAHISSNYGSMAIRVYVGARKLSTVAHDYERRIDDPEEHARCARLVFRQLCKESDKTLDVSCPVTVNTLKLPDACNHDFVHEVCFTADKERV